MFALYIVFKLQIPLRALEVAACLLRQLGLVQGSGEVGGSAEALHPDRRQVDVLVQARAQLAHLHGAEPG